FQRELATSYVNIGQALKLTRHRDEAVKTFRMAQSHWEKVAAAFPDETIYRSELAQAHVQLAYLLPRPQAEQEFRKVVSIYEILVAETHGEHAGYLANLGHNRRFLATNLWAAGDTKEAEKLVGEAAVDFEKLSAAHPDEGQYWHFHSDSQRR